MHRDVLTELSGENERRKQVRKMLRRDRKAGDVHAKDRRYTRAVAMHMVGDDAPAEPAPVSSEEQRARYFRQREAEAAEINEMAETMRQQHYEEEE